MAFPGRSGPIAVRAGSRSSTTAWTSSPLSLKPSVFRRALHTSPHRAGDRMLSPTPCLLSINNYFYPRGGAEVLFLEQNRMFEDIGWQVVPFSMRHSRNLPTPWSDFFPDEIEFGESYGLASK